MSSAEVCRIIREKSRQALIIVQVGLFTEPEHIQLFHQCGADIVIDRKEKDLQPLQAAIENLQDLSKAQ